MSFTFHHLKSGAQGPEGWPRAVRAFTAVGKNPSSVPRTRARQLTSAWDSSLKGSDALCWAYWAPSHTCAQTNTQTHTIYTMFKKGTMFSISLCTSMLTYHSSQIYNILITSERNSKSFSDHLVSTHPTL